MSFSSPFSLEPCYETPLPPDSIFPVLTKSPENDILNAFKVSVFPDQSPIGEKGKKVFETQNLDVTTSYICNDISISNPNLANMIENFLRGIPPNDQELQQLNDVEIDLFNCIREKKICTDEERNKGGLLSDIKVKKGKRMEESQKLFFKKAYAYLESDFFKKQLKNKKKIQKRHKNYLEFYTHYFGDTSKLLNIDIENFYHPHKSFKVNEANVSKKSKKTSEKKKMVIPGLKSFNKTYIELILNSKVFRSDLELYLENHFIKDCEANRHRKVLKFLNHCKKIKDDVCLMHSITTPLWEVDETKKDIQSKLRSYILNDGKAKLPWSDSEILQAYNVSKSLIIF